MTESTAIAERTGARFRGLRMTADEFLQIPDDGYNYELIDGVVMMSPSPTPQHQRIAMEIAIQLGIYLRDHPVGAVLPFRPASSGAAWPTRRGVPATWCAMPMSLSPEPLRIGLSWRVTRSPSSRL